MKKLRFLHIIKDDKFADPVIQLYKSNTDIESEFIYYGKQKGLRYIKGRNDVDVYEKSKDFKNRLKTSECQVFIFHSLQTKLYRFVKDIPNDKIVIWWSFGYDIYGDNHYGPKSFVKIDIYRPETRSIIQNGATVQNLFKRWLVKLYINTMLALYKGDILRRVDFFQPVLPYEFSIIQPLFKRNVKLFLFPGIETKNEFKFIDKPADGIVVIGNSASPINNHADVWHRIKNFVPPTRDIVVPLSYGNMNYAKMVKKVLGDEHNMRFLDTFLPREEYFSIVNSCSYAVHGSMRQHAMGNIYFSLMNGVKVFLFRDSSIYKYLTGAGFVVYAIDDVDERSFCTPLSISEQKQNYEALLKENEYRNRVGSLAIKDINNRISKINMI